MLELQWMFDAVPLPYLQHTGHTCKFVSFAQTMSENRSNFEFWWVPLGEQSCFTTRHLHRRFEMSECCKLLPSKPEGVPMFCVQFVENNNGLGLWKHTSCQHNGFHNSGDAVPGGFLAVSGGSWLFFRIIRRESSKFGKQCLDTVHALLLIVAHTKAHRFPSLAFTGWRKLQAFVSPGVAVNLGIGAALIAALSPSLPYHCLQVSCVVHTTGNVVRK